ncbi:MAG TPA: carbohydrate porin [Kofleriaceae bacterium]
MAVFARVAQADEFATSPVRAGYEAAQHRLLDSDLRTAWEESGFRWDATYAGEIFVAPQLTDRFVAAGLFTAELELDFAKLVHASMGAAHVQGLAIHGDGLTEELMDVHGVSGNVAPPDVRLYEAWYEQPISAFTLRGGLLAADQEFVLADRSTTLLGATFGITSQFSANVIGPVYPVATPGLSGRLELAPVVVRAAIYDGTQVNDHGIPTQLGPERLVIGEVQLFETFKLGAWHHTDRGYAYYAIADTHISDLIGAFTRAGISPDQPVDVYVDGGVRIGPGPLRPDDFISVGMAYARTELGAQITIEASYEAQVRWLTLQPDVQLVMLRDRTIGVIATRATVVF